MAKTESNTESYRLLPNGRLADPAVWSVEAANYLAGQEGITLTEEHWAVINVMRNYYHEFNISPVRKLLKKSLAEQLGTDKANDEYLLRLFPNDVLMQGTRIAGLPAPLLDAELDHAYYAQGKATSGTTFRRLYDEIEFEGRQIKLYAQGNLVNLEDWNERLAQCLAEREDITLTDDHWEVLQFLRRFYFDYGIAPMVHLLRKHMQAHLGSERSSKEHLYKLFPGGPARQGSRIAGLPDPQGCIDP